MDLVDVIKKRKSIRKFMAMPVSVEGIRDILATARKAPTAGGIRGYEAVIVEKKISPYHSPLSIVVCAVPDRYIKRYGNRGRELYAVQDATLFAGYIQLLLTNCGLDSVWVGAFKERKLKKELGLPDRLKPIAILQVGYRI
jgi:nitroreductase